MFYDYLIEFLVVAQAGSLAGASHTLALSQSALSRHMRELEQGLGVTLFERNPTGVKGMRLTEDGRFVFSKASDMSDVMDQILQYVAHKNASKTVGQKRSVSIDGVSDHPTVVLAVHRAIDRCPEASAAVRPVFVSQADAEKLPIERVLGDRMADLYITCASDDLLGELGDSFEVVPLYEMPMAAVLEPTNPLAGPGGSCPRICRARYFDIRQRTTEGVVCSGAR